MILRVKVATRATAMHNPLRTQSRQAKRARAWSSAPSHVPVPGGLTRVHQRPAVRRQTWIQFARLRSSGDHEGSPSNRGTVVSSRRTIPPPPTSARSGLTKVDARPPVIGSLSIRARLVIAFSDSFDTRVSISRRREECRSRVWGVDTPGGCLLPLLHSSSSPAVIRESMRQSGCRRRSRVRCQSILLFALKLRDHWIIRCVSRPGAACGRASTPRDEDPRPRRNYEVGRVNWR